MRNQVTVPRILAQINPLKKYKIRLGGDRVVYWKPGQAITVDDVMTTAFLKSIETLTPLGVIEETVVEGIINGRWE